MASTNNPAPKRNNDLAQIHIAKKALAMSDDSYRGLLVRITGKDSTQHMSLTERSKILAEFKRLGWNPKAKAKPAQPTYARKTSRLMAALWGELYRAGKVSNKSPSAFKAWIKGETGKESPDFLSPDETDRLINALRMWGKRPVKEAL